jgi:hypothetical protein
MVQKAGAPKKATPRLDDADQSERFIKTARELSVDESGESFLRAFKEIVSDRKAKPKAGRPR